MVGWFNKAEKESKVSLKKECNFALVKIWSDEKAKYIYELQKQTTVHTSNGKSSTPTVRQTLATGSKTWANKIAAHYGITVPTGRTR